MIVIKVFIKKIYRIIFKETPTEKLNRKKQEEYQKWIEKNDPDSLELEKQRNTSFQIEPKISIVIPLYNTPEKFFEELIECINKQTYTNWEICLADGSTEENKNIKKINELYRGKIKYKYLNTNKGISGNTNEAIKLATGDFIALMDQDDLLPPNSLFEVVKAINTNPEVEFIYTDEDKISSENRKRFEPHFKPDFSLDFLRANNYICHFSVFKKELMNKLEGERSEYDGAQDFDLILRMSEIVKAQNIVHIPKILYHWRVHPNSTSQLTSNAKPYAFEAGINVIKDHLQRMNIPATVEHGESLGTYKVQYIIKGNPKVSIIIKNAYSKRQLKKCINSITKKTNYKNYEIISLLDKNIKQINKEIQKCNGEYIVLLDGNSKMISNNWIEKMLGFAQREDIGAVGIRIYNSNNKIKHAGIIIECNNAKIELFKGLKRKTHGYFAREATIQNFNAVSSECMMFKKSNYDEVGGFDESFGEISNIDFCLKLREKNKLIVYNPFVELISYDKTTKESDNKNNIDELLNKWKKVYETGDSYYNTNFSQNSNIYDIKI